MKFKIFIFAYFLCFIVTQHIYGDDRKKIFILNSYQFDLSWSKKITNKIIEKLFDDYELYYQFLDARRYFGVDIFNISKNFYKEKYKNINIDLIIVIDNDAFEFIKKFRKEIFGSDDIPIVFCGINFFKPTDIKGIKNITGVAENINIEKTLDLALKQNNTDKIYIIMDDSITDKLLKEELIAILKRKNISLNIFYLEEYSYNELKIKIKEIKDGFIILFPFSNKDKKHYSFDFTAKEFAGLANVPIYTFWSMFIENGCTGGAVVTPELQGELVASLAKRILQGESVDKIPVINEDFTKYMFNWHSLKKFKLERKIPGNSTILYKPKSIFETNPEIIVIMILMVIIIILLIILFLRIKFENRNLERAITEKTKILEKQNEYIIQNEKMASLGTLVSGVAHEINTPLGVCITAFSYLKKINEELNNMLETNNLTEDDFKNYQSKFRESVKIIETNLNRSAELVQSFKRISVDQSSEVKTQINMYEYINNILISLKHEYKNKDIKIQVDCDKDLVITTYPGVFVQILTNFIMNSLLHGFDDEIKNGIINISFYKKNDHYIFIYKDNGIGIPKNIITKIYDPFFTTKKNLGGSGLGLNIVYNLVTMKLNGKIQCNSEEGKGVEFIITFKDQ